MRKLGVYRFGGRGGFGSYKHYEQRPAKRGRKE